MTDSDRIALERMEIVRQLRAEQRRSRQAWANATAPMRQALAMACRNFEARQKKNWKG